MVHVSSDAGDPVYTWPGPNHGAPRKVHVMISSVTPKPVDTEEMVMGPMSIWGPQRCDPGAC